MERQNESYYPALFLLLFCLPITCLAVACVMQAGNGPNQERVMVSAEDIDKVLEKHSEELLAIPGVEGAARGICRGKPCLKVYVGSEVSGLTERIGEIVGELPAVIEKSGSFQAL